MKKAFVYFILIAAVFFCLWLALRRNAQTRKPPQEQGVIPSTQSSAASLPTTNSSQQKSASPDSKFRRPAGIDDEGWKWLQRVRQRALSANQPIEFYGRALDQNDKPVEGAKLILTLTYVDEEMFRGTNFFHMNMGDEMRFKPLELMSDADGWIKLSGIKGESLRVQSLSKEGYSWTMPQIGSFIYEQNGKHRVGHTEMEDAFNPNKGYIFHLQKDESK
jgi:hypothetical protein